MTLRTMSRMEEYSVKWEKDALVLLQQIKKNTDNLKYYEDE